MIPPLRVPLLLLCLATGSAAVAQLPPLRPAQLLPKATSALTLDLAPAADGRWIAVGERGHLLLRTPGHPDWRQLPGPTDDTLTAVSFSPDGQTGLVVGHGGIILRSTDAGQSWTVAHRAEDVTTVFLDVLWTGPQRAFVAGAYGRLLWTDDGGVTFRERVFLDELHLNRIGLVPETGTLFLVGEAGLLLRSDDGGERWEPLDPPYEGSLFAFLPLPDGSILVGGLRGHLFRSADGGQTWTDLPRPVNSLLASAALVDKGETIVVVGSGGPGLISRDGGATFVAWPLPFALAEVARQADGTLIGVGEHGPVDLPLPPP